MRSVSNLRHAGGNALKRTEDFRVNIVGGHTPGLRGCCDQHRARSCAEQVEVVAVVWRRIAATGTLAAVFRRVEVALLDRDALPRHLELFSDDHRERRLNTLAHFGLLRDDGDGSAR